MTVSVPGNSNIAPYAERSYFATFNHVLVNDGNGKYGIQSAVSGAAPVLTGIIALMLEANPLLNSVQVKEILQNTARSDNFTGTTPNTKWGYGKVDAFAAVSEVLNATSVQEVKNELPNEFVLNQNYPNPFNPTTSIKFNLPTESKVRLNVFNVLGEEVAELVNNNLQAGFHSVQFDARSLNSGIYFYKIEAGDPSAGSGHGFVQIRKMMLLK